MHRSKKEVNNALKYVLETFIDFKKHYKDDKKAMDKTLSCYEDFYEWLQEGDKT